MNKENFFVESTKSNRREFVRNISFATFALLSGQLFLDEANASTTFKLPSSVTKDDPRIMAAYKYVYNLDDATTLWFTNAEYVQILLWLKKSPKVDKSLIVEKWSPLSLISPVYAALVAKLGSPLTQEHISKWESLWNKYMWDLVRWINLIPKSNWDHFTARQFFLKNMIEIAQLTENDYSTMSSLANVSLTPSNVLTQFPLLNADKKMKIFNKLFASKVLHKQIPAHKLDWSNLPVEALKDPWLALKNFYFSMGFYAVAEDFITNWEGSVSWQYRYKTSFYWQLEGKFGYHTAQQPILFWPITKKQ